MVKYFTPRLIMKLYQYYDVDKVYKIVSDKETMKYFPKTYDIEYAKRYIDFCQDNYRKHHFGWYPIYLKTTNEYIGDCGITMQKIDDREVPELGYHIYKDYQRQGYATEASQMILEDFFHMTDYQEIYSLMSINNIPSYKTAESLGFKRIGETLDKHYGQLYIYCLTKEDYLKKEGKDNE